MARARLLPLVFALTTALITAFTSKSAAAPHGKYLAYVGTYTTGASKGIYAYSYDPKTGDLADLGLAAATTNPSFLAFNATVAVDPSHHFLYAVNEIPKYEDKASGGVSAFSIDAATGKLTFLNEVSSGGADPCYIIVDKSGKFVLVANYTGGSVAVFPILKDGKLGNASAFVQHTGTGPDHERQEGPHAHWIETTPDNRFAIASDLGLDELLVYHFDADKGSLTPNDPPFAKVEGGAGPRHFAFHPNGKFGYVVDEMAQTVNAFSFDAAKGTLQKFQTISTIPAGFTGKNDTAEIEVHPNGKFLYASNRGHDSIAIFAMDSKKGTLKLLENIPVQGKTPRSFAIDPTGTRLFVANEESDNVVAFTLNPKTGHLTPTGKTVKVSNPVCIKFTAVE